MFRNLDTAVPCSVIARTPARQATRGPRALHAALLVIAAATMAGCSSGVEQALVPGGDPKRGELLLRQFGCGACHRIPGVALADGNVGPPLEHAGRRVYIAGVLPNTPDNMIRFIRAPQAVDPLSAMPDLGLNEPHARDIVAYLYKIAEKR